MISSDDSNKSIHSYIFDENLAKIKAEPLIEEALNIFKEAMPLSSESDDTLSRTKRLDELASKTALIYQKNLKSLVNLLNEADNFLRKKFIELAIEKAISNIEKRVDNEGIIYQVTNTKGTISYLVGTIHIGTFQMTKNSFIERAIKNSKELITEVGDFLSSDILLMPSGDDNFGYMMDAYFTNFAKQHGIKISGLETLKDQLEDEKKIKENTLAELNHNPSFSPDQLNRLGHLQFIAIELIEAWQNGDEDEFKFLSSLGKIADNVRKEATKKWLSSGKNDLINKLKNTEEPICIIVGASHLLGKEGLVEAFKLGGLTVSKMSSRDIVLD